MVMYVEQLLYILIRYHSIFNVLVYTKTELWKTAIYSVLKV